MHMISVDNLANVPSGEDCVFWRDPLRGGVFHEASTGFADGGLIIDAGGRLWKRIYEGPLNPYWWGAAGDGLTDDTYAMNVALFYSGALGKELFINKGQYRITDALVPKDNPAAGQTGGYDQTLRIIGEKNGTGIGVSIIFDSPAPSTALLHWTWKQAGSNNHGNYRFSSISNIEFVCQSTGTAQDCLLFDSGRWPFLLLDNLKFTGFKGYAIRLTSEHYSHCMNFRNLEINNCGGFIQTVVNQYPSFNGLNGTTSSFSNIKIAIGPNASENDIHVDLKSMRKIDFDSLRVTGVNPNSNLSLIQVHRLKSVHFRNIRVWTSTPNPLRNVFLIGNDPHGTPDLGVITIENFRIHDSTVNYVPIEVNSNCMVKLKNLNYFRYRNVDQIVKLNSPGAKVMIDGVQTDLPFTFNEARLPSVTTKNVKSTVGPSYSHKENNCLFSWQGEAPLSSFRSKHVEVVPRYTSTLSRYSIEEEGRVQKFTHINTDFPLFQISLRDLPDSISENDLMIAMKYKVITTPLTTSPMRGGYETMFITNSATSKARLIDRKSLNDKELVNKWGEAYGLIGNVRADTSIYPKEEPGFNTRTEIWISSIKVIHGKNLPTPLQNIGAKERITFRADAAPDGDYMIGDKFFYKSPTSGNPVGMMYLPDVNGTLGWVGFGVAV